MGKEGAVGVWPWTTGIEHWSIMCSNINVAGLLLTNSHPAGVPARPSIIVQKLQGTWHDCPRYLAQEARYYRYYQLTADHQYVSISHHINIKY